MYEANAFLSREIMAYLCVQIQSVLDLWLCALGSTINVTIYLCEWEPNLFQAYLMSLGEVFKCNNYLV